MARVESKGRYGRSPEGNNVEEFRRRLSGTIVRPGDAEYDTARAVWNGMIDRRPAIIAYCTNVNDVIQSIAFGQETGILTSVRSGGHNIAGSSLCDGGLVIDLSRMNTVTVDPENRIARAEGGALLADLDAATPRRKRTAWQRRPASTVIPGSSPLHSVAESAGLVASTG